MLTTSERRPIIEAGKTDTKQGLMVKFKIFRNVFIAQYIRAWQDGFDEGYRQGREMTINEVIGYNSLNEDKEREGRRIKR
jgi:hypothetical protein